MRGTRTYGWVVRLSLAVLAVTLVGLLSAPAAQAAAPSRSLTPFVDCYWDNGNGTVTVSVGVTSSNAGTVSVPVGTDNRITVGAADRGQPTSFRPGTHSNVWAATVTYAELGTSVNWQLTENTVPLRNFDTCSEKPVPAEGNALAVVAFGLLVSVIGAYVLAGRRRRALPGLEA